MQQQGAHSDECTCAFLQKISCKGRGSIYNGDVML
jgi:hypothetical protein